ncbi:histone acetyltransferase type B catalytic subunit-like [Rhopilema esculentum]|uniref:histone acetyltransferase type B catalytic subunit-like n=1 Tax=Rhopilema esculentum TaxID=499914 RepID=UPI0031D9FAD3
MAVGDVVFPKEEDKYKVDANEVIHMKLVRTAEDVKNESNAFQPEMSHQVFGDTESIFGYNGLHVKLYYHAGSLLTYLGMEYKGKVPDSLGIEADKVLPNIAEILAPGYCTNLDEFVAKLPGESKFTPMGTKIHSYKVKDTEYEIYQVDISVPGFREYHERLQTFILWYIDAASFIDVDDEKWNFFLLFQKQKGPTAGYEYNICGYMTVYHYYAYPTNTRPRISQMLILPPYQKCGHGAELLQTVYNFYQPKEKVIDITVEDPSEDFIRLRDYVDCQRCISLPAFTPDNLINGFSDSMATEARQKFKISKLQARRVYEILRLNVTNTGDPEQYRNYRLDIKKRLNAPLKKEARYLTKLQSALSEEEFKAAMFNLSGTEKMKRLEEAFKLLEADYRRVLHRLATA